MQPSKRCNWAGPEQIYIDYHDNEWGMPEYVSHSLFEKLILEAFQSGLSWIIVLKKCDNFRSAVRDLIPISCRLRAKRHRLQHFSLGLRKQQTNRKYMERLLKCVMINSSPVSPDFKRPEKNGFKFCSPKKIYAFLQAAGMVNDRLFGCPL